MAMLDALVLSQRLTGTSDPIQAIAAYEEEMFTRMRHMTDNTMRNTEMFYAPDAADQVVRLFHSFAGNSSIELSNANTAEHEICAANN